jgi:hypothetical protein
MNKTKTTWTIDTSSWLVPARPDFEGIVEPGASEEIFFVTATSEDGVIFRHFHNFWTAQEALDLAARVQAATAWTGPEDSAHWHFFRVMYGSAAYCRDWRRYEAETELAERVEELGHEAAYHSLPDAMKMALA